MRPVLSTPWLSQRQPSQGVGAGSTVAARQMRYLRSTDRLLVHMHKAGFRQLNTVTPLAENPIGGYDLLPPDEALGANARRSSADDLTLNRHDGHPILHEPGHERLFPLTPGSIMVVEMALVGYSTGLHWRNSRGLGMITYVDFSLFESPAKVLVNTVNTVGVMGKGIAKEFKTIYPDMFAEYQLLCERGQFNTGNLWLYRTPHKWILNFPTKKHWRHRSKPEYVEAGLRKFAEIHHDARITSISFPMLGCGNGELDWKTQVSPLMNTYLRKLPVQIFIHITSGRPSFVPEHRDPVATRRWLRGQPQSLAFTEVWDDLVASLDHDKQFVTLDDKNERFTAAIFRDAEGGIIIDTGTERLRLHKEQLMDLWQQIRDLGICIPRAMPSGLDWHSKYLLPLLADLPYLRQIRQADKDSRLTRNAIGLLFRPGERPVIPGTPKQLQLV